MANRAMKDSGVEWIGKIPTHWNVTKLKNLNTFINGYAFNSSDLNNEKKGYPVIRIGDFDNKGLNADISNYTEIDFKNSENYLIQNDDILIAMSGATVGKVAIVKNMNKPHFINQRVGIIRSDIPSYIYHYLNSGEFLKYVYIESEGSAQPNISSSGINNFPIPAIRIYEQQKIAAFLEEKVSHIDNIIGDTKKSIENLKAYKQSLITETVTKGLDSNVEMKDSGIEWIGEIPSHWDTVKMKRLGNIRNGLTYKPIDIVDSEEGILVLRSGNIQNSQLSFQDNVHVKKEINPDLIVSKGDILICSRNGSRKLIGKNAIIEDDLKATFGAFMMLFRPNELPKYIYYILNSEVFNFYLGTFLTSTINQLTKGNFENMEIVFCPDADEQGKIVAFLDDKVDKLNSMIQDKENLLNEFESYKKSFIYEYVTGKKEVR